MLSALNLFQLGAAVTVAASARFDGTRGGENWAALPGENKEANERPEFLSALGIRVAH
jgi:hypothetical protein